MDINKILFVSPMYQELRTLIEKEALQKELRFVSEGAMTEEDLAWADALVCFNLKTNIDYCKIKWVHSLGAGVDRFLFKKPWDEKVLLTRTICSFGQRIAEYCLSFILKDIQLHDEFHRLEQQKRWNQHTPKLLKEQKLMIYGTGEIGQETAKILSGLGITVYGVSLSGIQKQCFHEVLTVDEHFSRLHEMDFIINTLPLTDSTDRFFSNQIFQHLSNAGFINVGRGASLDEQALLSALTSNNIRFAVLDVFSHEPLPENHPFWNHPAIFITPHISAVTTPSEGVTCFINTLKSIERNMPLRNQVNVKKGY